MVPTQGPFFYYIIWEWMQYRYIIMQAGAYHRNLRLTEYKFTYL